MGIGSFGRKVSTGELFDGGKSSNDRNYEVYSKYLCILRSSTEAGSGNRIGGIARVVDSGKNRVGCTDPLRKEVGKRKLTSTYSH